MANLGPDRLDDTLAACQGGAAEIAGAFSRAFDLSCKLTVGEPGRLALDTLSAAPGLVCLFRIGDQGAVALLAESCGLLPDWCAQPDATGQSKLGTLATELGMLLFPEDCFPDTFQAAHTTNLIEALQAGGAAEGACVVTLTLSDGQGRSGDLLVIWPLPEPEKSWNVVVAAAAAAPRIRKTTPLPGAAEQSGASLRDATHRAERGATQFASEQELPSYSRSLLRIQVPVMVTLATKKQSVGRIVEIGPGSILQFDKSCDELLELEVGGQTIAVGEAVKVGDKFGIRLSSLILPDERFFPVGDRDRSA